MRLLTYILVGIGAAIAVVALAVVLLDDGGPDAVEPQADNGQSVTATASTAGDAPADQQAAADTLMIRNRAAAPASRQARMRRSADLLWKLIWRR
ncbi:MAG: hypothetical protein CM15mP115_20480 [Alphaproteobacteria bacterium]|nr:MAG: hypothetical protein CM15mP115_20480 [Alphaproteobacteria bacterium]